MRGRGVCRPGSLLALLRRCEFWSQSGLDHLSGQACQRGTQMGGRVGVVQRWSGMEKSRVDETGKTITPGGTYLPWEGKKLAHGSEWPRPSTPPTALAGT